MASLNQYFQTMLICTRKTVAVTFLNVLIDLPLCVFVLTHSGSISSVTQYSPSLPRLSCSPVLVLYFFLCINLKSTLFSTVHSYSQGTWVSSTGLTVSSHRSRGSIPHQIPPGLCHRLITLARGCQDNRAKDSTPLACPWASTTRSVPPYVLLYCLPYHAASTRKKHYVEVDTN